MPFLKLVVAKLRVFSHWKYRPNKFHRCQLGLRARERDGLRVWIVLGSRPTGGGARLNPDSEWQGNFNLAYIAQRAPPLLLLTVILACFQLFLHPWATTMAVSAAFRGMHRPKDGKWDLYGKSRTSSFAYRKPEQIRRLLCPSKQPASQQHRPTSWILMLLTSLPFRRTARPAALLRPFYRTEELWSDASHGLIFLLFWPPSIMRVRLLGGESHI